MQSMRGMSHAAVKARTKRRRRPGHSHRRGARYARSASSAPRGSTLLALVVEVQQRVENDAEVVRIIRWLVNSGAVVLTGSFAGSHF
jgi:hypothetical protein